MVIRVDWWDRFLWWLGFSICHQQVERILQFGDNRLFLCARDTGLFVGLFTTAVTLFLAAQRLRHGTRVVNLVAGVCVSFFLWDSLTSYLGLRETTNLLRFLSGFSGGVGLGLLLLSREGLPWSRITGERDGIIAFKSAGPAFAIPGIILLVYLWRPSWLFRFAQVYLFVSLLGSFTLLNLLLLATFVYRGDSMGRKIGCGGPHGVSRMLAGRFPLLIVVAAGMTAFELAVGHLVHSAFT
ncbi:MAG: DUF2085 domain-containing protein [Candidatus Geothermincolales bacterium]